MLDQVHDAALLPHRVLALHVEHIDAELLVQHDDDEELQQQREEEVGHRETEVRERRGRVVEQRVLPNRAHDADDQGEDHREHQCRPDQEQGVPGGFAHHVDDRTLGPERLAPVALHEVAQPAPVLRRTGLVEVVLVLQVAQRLLRDARTEPQLPQRIAACGHQRKHDDGREEDDDQRGQEAPDDEREHRKFLAERLPATAAIVRSCDQPE